MTMLDTERPVRVIDADSHMSERHDLWTRSAPPCMKDRMPYVTEVDGIPSWVVEGNVIKTARGGCVIDKDDNKVNAAYAGWPDRMYVVAADGKIAYKGGPGPGGFKPAEVEAWLRANAK